MKLKKLILHGFKSFADKTEFEFREGITVIVGPNGCGKSNVVDAVKWVLGEQRPSSLRGKEMQDVIFSGTDQRKPLGFAEVTLVFDNNDQLLPIEYEEVSITRRLFKSGESEYLINGNGARLRDIRELLMDSGGGPGALTVMEQGNIDRLLRADPVERRQVFEEAAGISKYRARRKETERKLERTNDNLARLRDILSEYETRQRSLKIQAGKARRWKEFTEELKKKRLVGALARYSDLTKRRESSLGELEEIGRLENEARSALEEAVTSSEDRRHELDAIREKVSAGEGEMAALVAESRASEEKQAARTREAEELVERAAGAENASREARERATGLEAELTGTRETLARSAAEREERSAQLESAESIVREVENRLKALRTESETQEGRRAEAFRSESEARNREVGGEAELRALTNRLDRLRERARLSGEELERLEQTRSESDRLVKGSEAKLHGLEERYAVAEEQARAARSEAEEAAAEEARHAGEERALSARREVLEKLVASGEGLTAGTRALLETGELSGIRGTVADLVGAAGPHASAVDQALGDLAGAVVVDTTANALAAIAWLKEGRRGRARLVPLDRVGEAPLPVGLTGLRPEAAGVVGALLAGTRVVASAEEALQAPRGERVVVLGGEEFESTGPIIGGTGDPGVGLVTRNTELAGIEAQSAEVERERRAAAERVGTARDGARTAERTLEELRPQLRKAREELRETSEGLAAAVKVATSRAEEVDLERIERQDVEQLLAQCEITVAAARREREQAERDRARLEEESTHLQDRILGASHERDREVARATEAKVEAARWIEKAEAAERRVAELEESIRNARREADDRGEEARICTQRRAECLDEIEVLRRLGEERGRVLDRLGKEVEEQRAQARSIQAELDAGDRSVRALRDAHERRREELERHRMRENELRLRIETLLEQVKRDHGFELDQVEAPETDEGAEAPDPDELEREIEDLRSRIERLGNVNHAALEELAEVESKLEFMRREEGDLVEAERQLRDTIVRIDDVCTTRFRDTFEKVSGHFRTTFRKLFGGGRAEILLEDPDDLLTSGIEIRVRPPGKEFRNMNLLSGGERSLTTVALLFSIYQTKPPPFCLLDEVDAALDEANTIRMCEMLREFALHGQFLIITHARPTMTVADTLYGVTMPEAGVSRRVAVKFQDIEAGNVVGLN